MAIPWKEDQSYLLNAIPTYRTFIYGKDIKTAKRITNEFAEDLYKNTPQLHHRTIHLIIQRLPYLDNLLAGVFEIRNYAKKDQHLYSLQPRQNSSKEPNLCNTRHSYNGAIR